MAAAELCLGCGAEVGAGDAVRLLCPSCVEEDAAAAAEPVRVVADLSAWSEEAAAKAAAAGGGGKRRKRSAALLCRDCGRSARDSDFRREAKAGEGYVRLCRKCGVLGLIIRQRWRVLHLPNGGDAALLALPASGFAASCAVCGRQLLRLGDSEHSLHDEQGEPVGRLCSECGPGVLQEQAEVDAGRRQAARAVLLASDSYPLRSMREEQEAAVSETADWLNSGGGPAQRLIDANRARRKLYARFAALAAEFDGVDPPAADESLAAPALDVDALTPAQAFAWWMFDDADKEALCANRTRRKALNRAGWKLLQGKGHRAALDTVRDAMRERREWGGGDESN